MYQAVITTPPVAFALAIVGGLPVSGGKRR
jgi:hypothetical protein